MEVGPPVGEESVEVVPVLLRERPVHCGGDGDDLVGLVDLRPHQFRLQQVDEELLHFGSVDLHKKSLDVSLYGDYEGCVTHPPFLVLLLPYRVSHVVVHHLLLTSIQKLCHSIASLH